MTAAAPRVLHVAAEAHPLIKTGGLADVAGALPLALAARGVDVRLLVPGYPAVLAALEQAGRRTVEVATLGPAFGAARIRLLRGTLADDRLPLYVIDAPWLYGRAGNPYVDSSGLPWADNHLRFGLLGWLAAQCAAGALDPDWRPDIVHAHDWHAGLAPHYLRQHPACPTRAVFTIHNLAFQGRFALEVGPQLGFLPSQLTPDSLEFHGDLSFMKAALTAADAITTVSPSYAREILTSEFGEGLEGVLRSRSDVLSGILNGIDADLWNPAQDPAIVAPYDLHDMRGKRANKAALQKAFGLPVSPSTPLFAMVGRLTAQKGVDLLQEAMRDPALGAAQFVMLGSGEATYERGLLALAAREPERIAVRIAFDEALSHQVFAGADVIVVPSRFEPCGLTQLYGLRYGAVPVVRRVGGLADTIVDDSLGADANGFSFDAADAPTLRATLVRALAIYRDAPSRWDTLMRHGMSADHTWSSPANAYMALYDDLLERGSGTPTARAP